ncbi:hypothetical protein C8Q75DRAFT_610295 [Abortiporus biennis]|nr:hypothetical protein C8Q75DRAFT_610295 [Abortiporus biennis]
MLGIWLFLFSCGTRTRGDSIELGFLLGIHPCAAPFLLNCLFLGLLSIVAFSTHLLMRLTSCRCGPSAMISPQFALFLYITRTWT